MCLFFDSDRFELTVSRWIPFLTLELTSAFWSIFGLFAGELVIALTIAEIRQAMFPNLRFHLNKTRVTKDS